MLGTSTCVGEGGRGRMKRGRIFSMLGTSAVCG